MDRLSLSSIQHEPLARYAVLLGVVAVVWLAINSLRSPRLPPGVPTLRISSLPGAAGARADLAAFIANGSKVMKVGYEKYIKNGSAYMLRTPTYMVYVCLPEQIEEIRAAPDHKLNPLEANNQIMQIGYTMAKFLETDQYHFDVVKGQLTRSLGPSLPDIVDECAKAFRAAVGKPLEWKTMFMWDLSFRIVTRTANRLLFGEDLAKNEEFLRLSTTHANTVFGGANKVRNLPSFIRPLVMWMRTGLYPELRIAKKHLVPLLEERLAAQRAAERSGKMADFEKSKPNDAIQWVLDLTPPEKRNIDQLVVRMLHIVVSAVHTSSVTFLDTIYDLVTHPEIHDELREEIYSVFADEQGEWRKQGLTKMVKMDSFMKESVRFHPLFAGQMDRIAASDFTFKNGTLIPKGTYVTSNSYEMYFDKQFYGEDAQTFDPWRYSKLRAQPGQESQHSFVQTSNIFMHFGHGKHACPGRFFAANEIKTLLVYLLVNYEVRLPPGAKAPTPGDWFSKGRTPDPTVNVEFRARKDPEIPWHTIGVD